MKINMEVKTIALMIGLAAMITSESVFAAAAIYPWESTATQAITFFTSGLTRSLAILAVIGLGIAALFGKMSWEYAGKIIIGIALIFGAPTVVDFFRSASL